MTEEIEASSTCSTLFWRRKLKIRRVAKQLGDRGLQSTLNGIPGNVVGPSEQLSVKQCLPMPEVEIRQSLEISAIHETNRSRSLRLHYAANRPILVRQWGMAVGPAPGIYEGFAADLELRR